MSHDNGTVTRPYGMIHDINMLGEIVGFWFDEDGDTATVCFDRCHDAAWKLCATKERALSAKSILFHALATGRSEFGLLTNEFADSLVRDMKEFSNPDRIRMKHIFDRIVAYQKENGIA